MTIRYVDTYSYKVDHLQINASLLVMLSKICDNVFYYAGKNSSAEVFKLLNRHDIELANVYYRSCFLPKGNSRYALLFRYFAGVIFNVLFLLSSKKDDLIVYNFNNLFSLHVINTINRILNRSILICCHGELELLITNKSGGLLFKSLRYLVRSFFLKNKMVHKKLYFLVFGDIIKENLTKILDGTILEKFISIDHPYIFEKYVLQNKREKFSIGSIGAFSKHKGGDLFVRLVSEVQNPQIVFSITGRIYYDLNMLRKLHIEFPIYAGKRPLSNEEFNKRVGEQDYILFLYDKESYKLTASGAIMDAINFRKPVISLRNDYFDYLFRKYGAFGLLFDDIEEMAHFLSDADCIASLSLVYDFNKIQKELSPVLLSKELHDKLLYNKILKD